MRVLIVSDAWHPQVNGVVTCLQALTDELAALGHEVRVLSPLDFRCIACPSYPEIPLALNVWKIGKLIEGVAPDCVHLATEGPLGWAARRWLKRRGLRFSSAIHTRFPEYVHTRWPMVPLSWGYAYLRRFHRPSQAVLVSTARMRDEFASAQIERLRIWRKGVDTRVFQPSGERGVRAVFLYVGRLAAEKNIEAFLSLDLPGEKRVIGDGPLRAQLQSDYPEARFLGYQHGEELARSYASANVLVFPSRTDTYGLVMVEALACGTPVAAFPVAGPLDVLEPGVTGVMHEDLRQACLDALLLDRDRCAELAALQSWRVCAQEFLGMQVCLQGRPLPLDKPVAVTG